MSEQGERPMSDPCQHCAPRIKDLERIVRKQAETIQRLRRIIEQPAARPRLTGKQSSTLHFIKRYRAKNGCSPTSQEIGDEFGISRVAAFERTTALKKKGYLKGAPKSWRNTIPIDEQMEIQ